MATTIMVLKVISNDFEYTCQKKGIHLDMLNETEDKMIYQYEHSFGNQTKLRLLKFNLYKTLILKLIKK